MGVSEIASAKATLGATGNMHVSPWAGGGAASTPAHQQILDLATTDGWLEVWDATNPDTRTTREDAGTTYASAIAGGLGNLPDFVQATEASQPVLSVGGFGQLDALDGDTTKIMKTATFASPLAQPLFILYVCSVRNPGSNPVITDGLGTSDRIFTREVLTNALQMTGPTGLTTANDAIVTSEPFVFGGLANGASSEIYVNSALVKSGDVGANALAGLTILGNFQGGQLDGLFNVMMLFDGDPGATKRQAMLDLIHDLTGIAKA